MLAIVTSCAPMLKELTDNLLSRADGRHDTIGADQGNPSLGQPQGHRELVDLGKISARTHMPDS